eukprot:GEMP01029495.1.p1 GENE.GEMP01029495.1~~GEMP01029495.1.p1  ORF type:complete len:478 (+),score=98.97 GEMP01029495.1:15-1448(+)
MFEQNLDPALRHDLFASDLPLLRGREESWVKLRRRLHPGYEEHRAHVLYGLENLVRAFDDGRPDLIDRVLYVSFGLWERGLARLGRRSTLAAPGGVIPLREQLVLAMAAFSLALKYEDHRYPASLRMVAHYGGRSFPYPMGECVRASKGGTPPSVEEVSAHERSLWETLGFSIFPVYPSDFLTMFHATLQLDEEHDEWSLDARTVMKGYRADATKLLIHVTIRNERFYAYPPSLVAAAAMYATVLQPRWPIELEEASGYNHARVRRLALQLHAVSHHFVAGTSNAKYLPSNLLKDELLKREKRTTPKCSKRRKSLSIPPTPLSSVIKSENCGLTPIRLRTPSSSHYDKSPAQSSYVKRDRDEEENTPSTVSGLMQQTPKKMKMSPPTRKMLPPCTPKKLGMATPAKKKAQQLFQPTMERFLERARLLKEGLSSAPESPRADGLSSAPESPRADGLSSAPQSPRANIADSDLVKSEPE